MFAYLFFEFSRKQQKKEADQNALAMHPIPRRAGKTEKQIHRILDKF